MADALNTQSVVIEPEMLDIIAELDEFKGAWRALSTLAPERLSALRRVATIESIGSSTRIEGSKLSDQDVEKLLSNVEVRSFETRDEQEVAGSAVFCELSKRYRRFATSRGACSIDHRTRSATKDPSTPSGRLKA